MKQIPNTQTVLALQTEEGAEAMGGTGATNGSGAVLPVFQNQGLSSGKHMLT